MSSIAIIIPCFNEAARLEKGRFTGFLSRNPSRTLVFVNDGSTDATEVRIEEIRNEMPAQVLAIHLETNQGKAAAVAKGISHCLLSAPDKFDFIGYLDADLSVSLEEMQRICTIAEEQKLDFAFGSRIKKLNSTIQRSSFRHITGRMIATIIDSKFNLGIYDTQCGAKLFSTGLARIIMNKQLQTRWLFDIEIFLIIRRDCPSARGAEIPLEAWSSVSGSKLNALHAGTIMREILRLFKHYPVK
jgi:glycosyltransferase involved in cell wall biosynthesis